MQPAIGVGDIFGSGNEIIWKDTEIEYDILMGFEQVKNEEVQLAIVNLHNKGKRKIT
ncbi:14142_t:CDS:2 [Gigaspora rosea]|nr:14142_t:CDS:2 [Gigaspora rosea]